MLSSYAAWDALLLSDLRSATASRFRFLASDMVTQDLGKFTALVYALSQSEPGEGSSSRITSVVTTHTQHGLLHASRSHLSDGLTDFAIGAIDDDLHARHVFSTHISKRWLGKSKN